MQSRAEDHGKQSQNNFVTNTSKWPAPPPPSMGPVTWDPAHWRTAAASSISGDTGKFCLTKGTAHNCSGVLALLSSWPDACRTEVRA